jgi:hypothetical protein
VHEHTPHDYLDALAPLQAIVGQMATEAAPLFEHPTLARYRAVLSACYFYTRRSGEQLSRAALSAPTAQLRSFFETMAREEGWHFHLAERDISGVQAQVLPSPPAAVISFAEYWDSIPPERFFEYLGATFVLENLAGQVATRVRAALDQLGLEPHQTRFLLTHLEADDDHGRQIADLCRAFFPQHRDDILAGARAAARYWAAGVQTFLSTDG